MEKLIKVCSDKARELFLLIEGSNSYAEKNFTFDVAFSFDGGQNTCYINVFDMREDNTEVAVWKQTFSSEGYGDSLLKMNKLLDEQLLSNANKDGEIIEIKGKTYRLTLVE